MFACCLVSSQAATDFCKPLALLLALASDSFESKVFLLFFWQSLAKRSSFGMSQWLLAFR